jgi:hypothetical protein
MPSIPLAEALPAKYGGRLYADATFARPSHWDQVAADLFARERVKAVIAKARGT